jgi:hypothetical protein
MMEPARLDEYGRTFLAFADALRRVRTHNARLAEALAAQRRATATGRTDWMTTNIHRTCPGVVAHGVIFNAIMTGEFWHAAATARLSAVPASPSRRRRASGTSC